MWFIKADMLPKVLVGTLVFCIFVCFANKFKSKKITAGFSAAVSLTILALFSHELLLFYVCYTVITFFMLRITLKLKRAKKIVFVIFTVLFIAPFAVWRTAELSDVFNSLVLVGFSYNMLKAVDALFYVYYTDTSITFVDYINFIVFFPVFTAGPIFRYRDFIRCFEKLTIRGKAVSEGVSAADQTAAEKGEAKLAARRGGRHLAFACIEPYDVNYGIKRFIKGMFKKTVMVATLTMAFERMVSIEVYCWYTSLITVFLSYVILYADLSGYSDMAIGIGRIMGIVVPENFKRPWTAPSFTQFWRRWHVTLSDWIREHIFVVVQGKKLNRFQSALIGMCTMIVMSLWHEFSVMTVIGGVYMGLFLVAENIFSLSVFNVRKEKKYKYFIRCILVNFFFAVNTLTFSLDSEKIISILRGLVN